MERDVRQGRVRLSHDAFRPVVRQQWSLSCVDVRMQEDLRAAAREVGQSHLRVSTLHMCELQTHLIRGRFNLGRRQ